MTRRLSQTQLKWIAVAFMTLDHIGAYCGEIPAVGMWYDLLRILGRIAAPIFLYCMVESARHTRSRWKLLGRLALWHTAIALVFTLVNAVLFLPLGNYALGIPEMLMTFFYQTVLIMLCDAFCAAWRERNGALARKTGAVCAGLAALFFVQPLLADALYALTQNHMAVDLFRALVPQPFVVMYTPLFLLMGLAWYYIPDRRAQIGIFLAFNVLCIVGVQLGVTRMIDFFNPTQRWMFLAVPFLLLYSGERGRGGKRFFYWYYPLHILALAAIELFAA